jgi:hypothetical protein
MSSQVIGAQLIVGAVPADTGGRTYSAIVLAILRPNVVQSKVTCWDSVRLPRGCLFFQPVQSAAPSSPTSS